MLGAGEGSPNFSPNLHRQEVYDRKEAPGIGAKIAFWENQQPVGATKPREIAEPTIQGAEESVSPEVVSDQQAEHPKLPQMAIQKKTEARKDNLVPYAGEASMLNPSTPALATPCLELTLNASELLYPQNLMTNFGANESTILGSSGGPATTIIEAKPPKSQGSHTPEKENAQPHHQGTPKLEFHPDPHDSDGETPVSNEVSRLSTECLVLAEAKQLRSKRQKSEAKSALPAGARSARGDRSAKPVGAASRKARVRDAEEDGGLEEFEESERTMAQESTEGSESESESEGILVLNFDDPEVRRLTFLIGEARAKRLYHRCEKESGNGKAATMKFVLGSILNKKVVNPRGINPRGIKTKGAGELGHEISSGWEKILEELRVKGSNFYQTFEYLRVKNPDCGIPDLPFNSKWEFECAVALAQVVSSEHLIAVIKPRK
mmetsp:Transcript_32217/g.50237  ORF Transcript_32217/g.50237 Transcript_32217/m.50237 type:complete len:435 (-) Transcript_32217:304-1608(-)